MNDRYVRLALAAPIFAAYLLCEGVAEGATWVAGMALRAARRVAGE